MSRTSDLSAGTDSIEPIVEAVLWENFDSVTVPRLPSGWTTSSTSSNTWHTFAGLSDSEPNSVVVNALDGVSDSTLVSPQVLIDERHSRLSFRHIYETERGFDGGVLEISIEDGPFQDILSAGGDFVVGGYVDTIDPSTNNPIGGRLAWTGKSQDFATTAIDLPVGSIGRSVQFRWRFGSDSSLAGMHWAIDSITLSTTTESGTEELVAAREVSASTVSTESRRLNWSNRGDASDRFDETFGAKASQARAVVDAVFESWERVLTDLNHASFSGPGKIDINVSMQFGGTGFGASTTSSFLQGFPFFGSISIERGNDTNADGNGDGAGYFLDPTPLDQSEFMGAPTGGAFVGFAHSGSPAQNQSDLFTVVNAEITHAIGLFLSPGKMNDPINGTVHETTTADNAEGGGVGKYWVFDGPSVTHLMTSNNGGPTGIDYGQIIHTAGKNTSGSGQPVAFTSLYRGTRNLVGADDEGNAVYALGQRTMVSDVMALLLKDAYGYQITLPQSFGTIYSVLNESTRSLTLRGGTNNSQDAFDLSIDGNDLVVSIDIGSDVPGTGPNGDASNIAPFVSRFPLDSIGSILLSTGGGNDLLRIEPLVGIGITIDGGSPSYPNGGSGDSLEIKTEGVSGTSFDDNLDGTGSMTSTSHGTISWSSIEQVSVVGAPRIESLVINGGQPQRSAVTDITLTFDQVVQIDELGGDPFQLINATSATSVNDVPSIDHSTGKTIVRISFPPGASVLASGSLADGEYTLTVLASQITANGYQLDGDGDGSGGDDVIYDASDGLFRQYGDHNGNGATDLLDFADFRSTFGKSLGESDFLADLDADNDDTIGLLDFAEFRRSFG